MSKSMHTRNTWCRYNHFALDRLHFTTFFYPDDWRVQGLDSSLKKPMFFVEYPAAFDPHRQHQGSPYSYTRPTNDAALSYDALITQQEPCFDKPYRHSFLLHDEQRVPSSSITGDSSRAKRERDQPCSQRARGRRPLNVLFYATRVADEAYINPDTWQKAIPMQEGSWWPTWEAWLAKQSGGHVVPPPLGAPQCGYPQLAAAPGSYVLQS